MILKNITLNSILTIILLISHSYTWNMEKNLCLAIIPYTKFNLKTHIKKYNEEYNINNSPLVALAPEMLETVLAKILSPDEAIKTALALRVTCETFYKLPLEHFGKAYKHHDLIEKNKLLASINYYNEQYYNKLCNALILILAGAQDTRNDSLIMEAILHNDTEIIDLLFKKNAVSISNQTWHGQPIFCFAIEPQTLKTLIENRVDLNQKTWSLPNALWHFIQSEPSSKLIKLCLDNHVNATIINPVDGNCLLHLLVSHPMDTPKDINDYVKTGELVLNKILNEAPHLVNQRNYKGETPIDTARQYNIKNSIENNGRKVNKQLIASFRQHSGKTAKQLEKHQKQYQQLVCQIKEFSHHDHAKE